MAQHEWQRMKSNDSQECRNCHNVDFMDLTAQKSVAAKMHDRAVKAGRPVLIAIKALPTSFPICAM